MCGDGGLTVLIDHIDQLEYVQAVSDLYSGKPTVRCATN